MAIFNSARRNDAKQNGEWAKKMAMARKISAWRRSQVIRAWGSMAHVEVRLYHNSAAAVGRESWARTWSEPGGVVRGERGRDGKAPWRSGVCVGSLALMRWRLLAGWAGPKWS
jgi:hypothetical protein